MVEVDVINVAIDMKSKMPVIVLKEKEGDKTLPIWIGLFEAQSIALAMENIKPPRPLTHDLAKSLIEKLKGKVDRVVINDLRHNTFYAKIMIRQNGEDIQVDSRPSDAIALALRLGVPIFIEEEVLDKVAIGTGPIDEKEIEEFRKKLKDLKPEDFSL
ncbi:bifunctional nuclease family protein [Candidatus Aerophobetes bacterium]|nr:bifunctional nuclease family protein [Candidatus Aerophobetes bacterium]